MANESTCKQVSMLGRNEAGSLLQHSAAPQGVQLYGDMACPTSRGAAPAVRWSSVCSLQPSSSCEETCRAIKSKTEGEKRRCINILNEKVQSRLDDVLLNWQPIPFRPQIAIIAIAKLRYMQPRIYRSTQVHCVEFVKG